MARCHRAAPETPCRIFVRRPSPAAIPAAIHHLGSRAVERPDHTIGESRPETVIRNTGMHSNPPDLRYAGATSAASPARPCAYRPPPNSRAINPVNTTAPPDAKAGKKRSANRFSPNIAMPARAIPGTKGGWSTYPHAKRPAHSMKYSSSKWYPKPVSRAQDGRRRRRRQAGRESTKPAESGNPFALQAPFASESAPHAPGRGGRRFIIRRTVPRGLHLFGKGATRPCTAGAHARRRSFQDGDHAREKHQRDPCGEMPSRRPRKSPWESTPEPGKSVSSMSGVNPPTVVTEVRITARKRRVSAVDYGFKKKARLV